MSHLQSLALISFSFLLCFCNSTDTISSSQQIQDPENLISQNGTFRLGFFSPPNSRFRYVGVLYIVEVNETTPIWVANKNTPLNDSLGSVVIAEDGNLAVLDGQKQVIWSSGVADSRQNTKARILDSGNLVLESNSSDDPIWESFQHPSDSYLQGMELSTSLRSGQNNSLVSWRSRFDPSTGSFKLEVRPLNIPEFFIRNGTRSIWRSGPWNGQAFLGVNNMNPFYSSGFTIKDDRQGSVSLTFTYPSTARFQGYYHLSSDGVLREMYWYEGLLDWVVSWSTNENDCFSYGKCGQFGICDPRNSPICDCLRGYEPLNLGEWSRGIWSGGCRRRSQLQCERSDDDRSKLDGFQKHENVKVPDFTQSILVIDECESECLKNCSCVAYSYSNGIGCMHWTGDLIDIVQFNRSYGADLYVRVAYSELDKKKSMKVVIIITVILVTIGAAGVAYFVWICIYRVKGRKQHENRLWFRKKWTASPDGNSTEIMLGNTMNRLEDMHVFEFKKLAAATGDFQEASKLGQGGFGPVYKGKLENGVEIAVKRLSRSSGQGLQEFMNEVVVISKLQHRNLVRLLGCCVENNEKILIYEYMPNGSLDSLLFVEQENLDWSTRVNIIEGIARGLLYLHRDSRLKIIHRDLKASNILLDQNLNPKISDFGLARIFGGDQDQANTGRVVGTYGYMSPEYAMEGRFSEKSDVYSFGVLLLEIIGGRRNSSFYYDEKFSSLLRFAWNLWNEEKITDFIDHKIRDPHVEPKILKCIHVGLLCVQEYAQDRPSVSTILSMLCGETSDLPSPNQPAFSERRTNSLDTPSVRTTDHKYSVNGTSFSLVEGR